MKKETGTLLLILGLLFSWLVLGLLATSFLMALGLGSTLWGGQILPFVPYFLLLGALWLLSEKLTGRKPLALLSPSFRWKHFLLPGGMYLLGSIALTFLEGEVKGSGFSLDQILVSMLLSLLLVPLGTFAEEILFRALPKTLLEEYKAPGKAKGLILMVFSALLFTLPHLGNPEVVKSKDGTAAILYYFLWGLLAMGLGLWDGGFECTFGIHTANNLFVAILVNYDKSALPSRALFLKSGEESSYILIMNALVLYAITGLAVAALRHKENNEQIR